MRIILIRKEPRGKGEQMRVRAGRWDDGAGLCTQKGTSKAPGARMMAGDATA